MNLVHPAANTIRAMNKLIEAHGKTEDDIKVLKSLNGMGSIINTSYPSATAYVGLAAQNLAEQNHLNQITSAYQIFSEQQMQVRKGIMEKNIEQSAKRAQTIVTNKKGKHMFGFAKEYLERHKDSVMTVIMVLIVDHFFLGGALRSKIKAVAESVLDNAQKKLSHAPAAQPEKPNAA